jgi:hypothetical protein
MCFIASVIATEAPWYRPFGSGAAGGAERMITGAGAWGGAATGVFSSSGSSSKKAPAGTRLDPAVWVGALIVEPEADGAIEADGAVTWESSSTSHIIIFRWPLLRWRFEALPSSSSARFDGITWWRELITVSRSAIITRTAISDKRAGTVRITRQ